MLQSVQRFECEDCNKKFSRVQELKRHLKEKHQPWRKCPFCTFEWTRPDKIKHHITTFHRDKFTPEVMAEFRELYGKKMTAFLEGLDHATLRPGVETAPELNSSPSPSRSPSPSPSRDSSPP